MHNNFDANLAFSRNLGWLTPSEQSLLANLHVGLVGLGGVGGQYAEILARLGVGKFTLYDADTFSIENTNRQNECKTSNYGKNKAEVIRSLILDINPTAKVTAHNEHLTSENVPSFCEKIDIYLDTLDFFVIDLRIVIFQHMRRLGKPAITVAPVASGAASLVFTADSMSFDDYFGLHRSQDPIERSQMFLLGLTPSLLQRHYLQDNQYVDLMNRRVPSLPLGVYSSAAVAATTLLKVVLKRGKVLSAPWSVHYDPYMLTLKKKYVWWGYKNPFQRIKFIFLKILTRSKAPSS